MLPRQGETVARQNNSALGTIRNPALARKSQVDASNSAARRFDGWGVAEALRRLQMVCAHA